MDGKNKFNLEGKKMSETPRCFLAFDLENNEILRKLVNVQKLIFKTGANLKIIKQQNLHLTLRFLGNITNDLIEKVSTKMQKIDFNPFSIELKGIGVFPNLYSPRVIWVGITEGTKKMNKIFDQIEVQLRQLAFKPDYKGFSPHLTLARVKYGKNNDQLTTFIKNHVEYNIGSINLNCIKLKKSELTPTGPIYATIKKFYSKDEV